MLHSKKCWVVLTQLWVKYGQSHWVKVFIDIFNLTFGLVHLTQSWDLSAEKSAECNELLIIIIKTT